MGELGRLRRYSGGQGPAPVPPEVRAAGEPNNFWVKNSLRLPKMQKIYIKMFGSNATFFKILSFTAGNTKSFALKATVF